MTGIRILIVDDHPIVREGIESMIALEADMTVVGRASSGQEAIALFPGTKPDVTLMDMVLKDMEGVEAIHAIRRSSPDARFLVVSALQREQDVFRAIKAGANGYLFKSAASTELMDAIRAVWSGARYLPADVAIRTIGTIELGGLTTREMQILRRIVAGEDNSSIAAALRIDRGTVKNHVHNILSKLDARTRTHAAAIALQRGLIQPPDA